MGRGLGVAKSIAFSVCLLVSKANSLRTLAAIRPFHVKCFSSHSHPHLMPFGFGFGQLRKVATVAAIGMMASQSSPFSTLVSTSFSTSSTALSCASASTINDQGISYIKADEASKIDELLMTPPGFSIDQLMELAGLAVAQSAHDFLLLTSSESKPVTSETKEKKKKILVLAGPGNNGGDGLVAARHLSHFGHDVTVVLPKQSSGNLFVNLRKQCEDLFIPILSSLPEEVLAASGKDFDLIVDALFGFSFKGPAREPFSSLINYMVNANAVSNTAVISVDIPSGWDVNDGDIHATKFIPNAVVSLTAPKICMKGFTGAHYLGGRFVPPNIATQFALTIPPYQGSDQILRIDAPLQNSERRLTTTATTATTTTDTTSSEHPSQSLAAAKNVGISAVLTTTPSIELAESIARQLVERKFCACVNIIPTIKSIYEWEGKVEEGTEALLIIKTRTEGVSDLTVAIKELHTYSVPEAIALDVSGGNGDYIDWVLKQTLHRKQNGN